MTKFDITKKGYDTNQVDNHIQKMEYEHDKTSAEQLERIVQLRKEVLQLTETLEEYKKRDKLVSNALVQAVAKAEEIEKVARQKYDMELKSLKLFHVKWISYYKQIIEKYPLDDTLMKSAQFNANLTKFLGTVEKEPVPKSEQTVTQKKSKDKTEAEKQYEQESKRISSLNASKGINIDAISEVLKDEDDTYGKVLESFTRTDFKPISKIKTYFDSSDETKSKNTNTKKASRRSSMPPSDSGFSIEEALNPEDDLETIMRELGLIED